MLVKEMEVVPGREIVRIQDNMVSFSLEQRRSQEM